jgi:ribosomal-protein-alanine N-acetyltransferase
MSDLEIRKLTADMIENVFEIEKTFFDVVTNSSIKDSLKSENLFYFVLFLDDEVVGFLEGSIVLDEAELYEIAIKNEYQGKGLSKKLMDYFLLHCKNNNVETIFLEVNTINNKAISLYEKYGFERYSIRKKYYGDNDAILMKLSLN